MSMLFKGVVCRSMENSRGKGEKEDRDSSEASFVHIQADLWAGLLTMGKRISLAYSVPYIWLYCICIGFSARHRMNGRNHVAQLSPGLYHFDSQW